jgi:hypothetical protein
MVVIVNSIIATGGAWRSSYFIYRPMCVAIYQVGREFCYGNSFKYWKFAAVMD